AVAFYNWHAGRTAFMRQWVRELEVQASMAAALLPDADGELSADATARFFARLGSSGTHRFTLILPDGRVLGDSDADAGKMESHEDRPEVVEALALGRGMRQRYSASLGKRMLYLAVRVPRDGQAQAVIRVAVPMQVLGSEMRAADRLLLLMVVAVSGVALILSYLAALRITRPVSRLQSGLARIGKGDLDYRLPIPTVPHLAELAKSINETAESLQKHVKALDEERNLRTLILANMTRGVVALDTARLILDVNDSALRFFGIKGQAVMGRYLGELVRYPELQTLVKACETAEEPLEDEMELSEPEVKRLNLRATALKDLSGKRIGTLLVVSDITLLRRLETVRQDFVSNVSHELRTPVTSIKGFAETLLDGAKDDPAASERFLKIILRQANQLDSIIRDLLDLSRLEQNTKQNLDRQPTPVAGVLKNAIDLCQSRSEPTSLNLSLECQEDLYASVHSGLVEQAVVNLIDNAIKYGVSGGEAKIEIAARREGGAVVISVRDYGPGIENTHLERLFERFYRVDKGRSRDLGGTGLGLAIVKHIALIHGGTADVKSEPGKGAEFILRLPIG
ncbi:MAG: ATP-binding protein, partial [Kiritimatiellae bacterium]|nr:ATP-binding protein [Kiritimatiellia bacterium]